MHRFTNYLHGPDTRQPLPTEIVSRRSQQLSHTSVHKGHLRTSYSAERGTVARRECRGKPTALYKGTDGKAVFLNVMGTPSPRTNHVRTRRPAVRCPVCYTGCLAHWALFLDVCDLCLYLDPASEIPSIHA